MKPTKKMVIGVKSITNNDLSLPEKGKLNIKLKSDCHKTIIDSNGQPSSKIKIAIKEGVSIINQLKKINFKGTLIPFQNDIYGCRMKDQDRGILALEMGLGKTIVMIYKICHAEYKKVLFIVPLPLAEQWRKALFNFTDSKIGDVTIYQGRKRHNDDFSKARFVITTYETVMIDMDNESSQLFKHHKQFDSIVLDEAHKIRNQNTKTNNVCNKLAENCAARWLLTGTPIMNSFDDLRSLSVFLNVSDINFDTHLSEWKAKYYIRFTKAEANLGLPDKTIYKHPLRADENHFEVYMETFCEVKEVWSKFLSEPGTQNFGFVLKKILRLRQCCNHPDAMLSKEEYEIDLNRYKAGQTSKFLKTMDIIKSSAEGDKIILFSQWTHTLDLMGKYLTANDISHVTYTGEANASKKTAILDEFEKGNSKIMLTSLHAGGVGLNLTCANVVILMDSWWNGSLEDQAIDRVYRIGQKKPVAIHQMYIDGSIEDWMLEMKNEKALVHKAFDTCDTQYEINRTKLSELLHMHV